MNRFKNILAVTGDAIGSDQVLSRAADLATANGAVLTVLEIVEDPYLGDDFIRERESRLDRLVRSMRVGGMDIRTRVMRGKAFLEITQHVLKHGNDLVIIAAEAPGGFRDLLFGSTTLHLMRKCPCPVWVLKPGESSQFKRILAAVDIHPFDDEENAVSHKVLQLATSLSVMDEAELHVVHGWDVAGTDAQALQSELPDKNRKDLVLKHLRRAENRLEGILAPYRERYTGIQAHVNRGEPWQVITAAERAQNIDLIIMGTIGRSNIPGFFIGTTAETVLRQVNCSVLTVKPEQFVSPIKLEDQVVYA